MANQDRVNFVWAESALTTIPPIPVSEVAYRDTTQTPEQMEVGQQYDTIYNSARYNQLLFLLTSVAKTLCENGIMPFLAGQEYSQYARCIFTDGKLYTASRAILANEQPYPTPGDNSGVWIAEGTSENLVPNSRRVIAGTGLTGGGPLSSDVTLSAKLDGKTTQAAAGGVITVKDVAIGGNLGDLASARGQIGAAKEMPDLDFNTLTTPGNYRITGNPTNGPSLPLNISGASIGSLIVAGTLGQRGRIFQIMISGSAVTWRTILNTTEGTWGAWQQLLSGNKVGDGIRVTNGIISVPEYDGATASTAGTSGLVPPATAGQKDSFLTGGGEYKPALTKISDSVNLADSKTAASAKAVKAAYDLANSKQPNLGFTPVQQGGGTGQGSDKIYIGYSKSGLKAQAGKLDLGNIVTTSAGCTKAPSATHADTATEAVYPLNTGKKRMYFDWVAVDGTPTKVWGTTDGQTSRVYNPSNFRVNYANSAGSALVAATAVQWVVNTSGSTITVPPGGTYDVVCICFNDSGSKGAVKHYPGTAGGTVIPNSYTDYFVAGLCARVA